MQTSTGDRRYYVYEHRRNDTGNPFYIGKGTGRRAYTTYRRNPLWKRIASKHGFTVVIARDNLTEKEAYAMEIGMVIIGKVSGCCEANMTYGGDGVVTIQPRGWGHKISASLKGIKKPTGVDNKSYKSFCTESELNELYINKGLATPEIAKMFSVSIPTVVARLRQSKIKVRESGKVRVKIICTTNGRVFDSIADAAKEYSLFPANIRKVINGKYKHTGNLKFEYYDRVK